ncbi:MAG: DNA translocase FtsK [Microgenomates group bacterium]
MDKAVQIILKKLDEIDTRLKQLEKPAVTESEKTSQANPIKKDPLFAQALEIIDKYDEISAQQLAQALKIDVKRAEAIMDQMEAAGLGVCYTKEV